MDLLKTFYHEDGCAAYVCNTFLHHEENRARLAMIRDNKIEQSIQRLFLLRFSDF